MTLNAASGISPSTHLHLSQHHGDPASTRRRNTVGSPTSAVFKPSNIALPQAPPAIQHAFLPLLAPGQQPIHLGGSAAGNTRYRSKSPSLQQQQQQQQQPHRPVSPHRRRPGSRSPVRVNEQSQGTNCGGWLGNGRKNSGGQYHHNPKSGTLNMQGKRSDVQQSIAVQRPPFRHPSQSMSVPSTPNYHHPRNPVNSVSRSPSPPACMLDSPRSASSEPVSASPYSKAPATVCLYETLLVDARRRMPYSLGIDKLKPEKPILEKLPEDREKALTSDMELVFERLKPSHESEIGWRKFLDKLSRILNEEWPGHDTRVHAFGSTENHLCMDDSDVDVCITTRCKEIESTCRLAAALAKRDMERIVCVPGAKVPIVKIWDPEYGVACDMNVNSTLALDNTRMIKTYVEIDDRVRPLALIIKHWTKQRVLNNAAIGGTLSSYTWICMILNFLQTREPPVLPSLHMIPHKKKPPNHGVDVSFADDIETLRGFGKDNKETLGELLFAFFKKYGHDLDYEKEVISVRAGKLLSKEDKGWQFLQNNRLCVEEPFNTGRNLGNTADDCSMRGIHMEFRRAYTILAETGDLAECCKLYEFPPEEVHLAPPPPAPYRPATLSRSNSSHVRNQNSGYSTGGQRGGRGGYSRFNRNNRNRGGSNGAAVFNQNILQPQYSGHPEMFGYDQLAVIQAQIQVQAQLVHAAQVVQMHNQQHQNGNQSGQMNGSSAYLTWPYIALAQYGIHPFFPGFLSQNNTNDASNPSTSPPRTPAAMADGVPGRGNDGRTGMGRGRRNGYNTSRSHSQPPSFYPSSGYRSMATAGVASSEDEEYGDHSSNSNPPETPPSDEYVGYYTIGGSLQPDLTVVDPHVGDEEPFLEQKDAVDRQKRLPPLLQSRGPSPIRQPVVNGGLVNPHVAPHSEGVFPFESGSADAAPGVRNNVNGTAEPQQQQQRRAYSQKVSQQGSPAARSGATVSPRPSPTRLPQHGSSTAVHPISEPATIASDASTTSEVESVDSLRSSPALRQRAASHQLLWTNSRPLTEEKVTAALSPVPESPIPTPNLAPPPLYTRKVVDSGKNGVKGTGRKKHAPAATKEGQPPPTPAPAAAATGQRNGGGRSKANGNKPAPAAKKGGAAATAPDAATAVKVDVAAPAAKSDTTTTTKSSTWKTKTCPKKKRPNPNVREAAAAAAAAVVMERKGG